MNKGPYTGFRQVCGIIRKSETSRRMNRDNPDLFFALALTRGKGYYPGYTTQDLGSPEARHQFTWLVLKAYTRNNAGTVRLRSSDPRDTPIINFHYFEEGTDKKGEDLSSIADGFEFVRRVNARLTKDISNGEVWPGSRVKSRDDIVRFIRDESWGHHASCTCKIGLRSDPMAVVDSRLRVHGVSNLRIVDASVFPRIPGYFILTSIYVISQKASEVILEESATMSINSRRNA